MTEHETSKEAWISESKLLAGASKFQFPAAGASVHVEDHLQLVADQK